MRSCVLYDQDESRIGEIARCCGFGAELVNEPARNTQSISFNVDLSCHVFRPVAGQILSQQANVVGQPAQMKGQTVVVAKFPKGPRAFPVSRLTSA